MRSALLIVTAAVALAACGHDDPPPLHGRIAYGTDGPRGDVFVVRADGSGARRVTHERGPQFDPAWSPDGRRIAYRDSRRGINNNDDIYIADADGSHARNLTPN